MKKNYKKKIILKIPVLIKLLQFFRKKENNRWRFRISKKKDQRME